MRKVGIWIGLMLLLLTACASAPAKVTQEAPSCTITIRCDTILMHLDELAEEKVELVPKDGCLLAETEVALAEGDTVFDVLLRVAQAQKIHLEFSATPLYDAKYIEGIGNLYELDCGALSGWTYSLNGTFPGYGVNQQRVSDGDIIQILYTCDLGADVGNIATSE